MLDSHHSTTARPPLSAYPDPVAFMRAMLEFRKQTENGFSIAKATKTLRKVSPTLVSLILKNRRRITLDRAEELCKLLNLNVTERSAFKHWIQDISKPAHHGSTATTQAPLKNRKEVGTSILNDWINAYVKDLFQIAAISRRPEKIEQQLRAVATPLRVRKALQFLLREGHLRRTLNGEIVLDTPLAIADTKIPSHKIRQFHKGALTLAKQAIDLYPASERLANTLTIPLTATSYQELVHLVDEFAEKLQAFAAENSTPADRLYQVIVNVSPVGGKLE